MRAVVLRETGGPEQLTVDEVEEPEQPALRVRGAGVNFFDVLVRRGEYPQMPPLPHVLGSEVARELDGRRGATFPLEQAAEAHRSIDERRHLGKVVLVP